ncbi:MAG TPA: GAF domain-containing sensor histidine kinase [Bacteroidota bacterium]|nr:GAF domain-containing sensor histidine kinase [Bacteroidota bacterium]
MKFHQLVEQLHYEKAPIPGGSKLLLPGNTIDLEQLLNVFKTINRSLILDDVIVLVLDNAIRIARAERGFLLLADEKNELHTVMARDSKDTTLNSDQYTISESIARDVYKAGESICVEHAQHDKLYDSRSSILSLSLETILCSPLIVRGEIIGVIYVDSKHIQPVNRNEIINLFEILAGQAAISLKNAQLYRSVTKAYNDLQNTNDVLLKMDRLAIKGEIAAEVSHELKNLFQVTLLQFDSLERNFQRLESEAALDRVKEAHRSVKRIELFARGLLENSSMKVNKMIGDLNRSITETVGLLQPLRKFKFAHIETSLDKDIPYCCFDTQQIQQLLLNLMNNAVEACSGATLTITSELLPTTHEILIRVNDDGPGITDEIIAKLFNEKITTKADGHGYGLSICKKIAENHYGTIKVSSSPGRGTTFSIRMPVVLV